MGTLPQRVCTDRLWTALNRRCSILSQRAVWQLGVEAFGARSYTLALLICWQKDDGLISVRRRSHSCGTLPQPSCQKALRLCAAGIFVGHWFTYLRSSTSDQRSCSKCPGDERISATADGCK